jgi:3-methyladenine DNA glycosylase/8-oxoguanine DNA glycosylase
MKVDVGPLNLACSMKLQRMGRFDPTAELAGDTFVKTFYWRGECITATLRYADGTLEVNSPEVVPWAFPLQDGYECFAPSSSLIRRLHAESGLRIMAVPWLFDVLSSCILQQRVTFAEACGQWRRIVERFGEGKAFPSAAKVAALEPWQLVQLGVDARRARTLLLVAREQAMTHFLSLATAREKLVKRLERIVGVGPWTMSMFRGFGLGETDSVIWGDVHLPRIVCQSLGGDASWSEARMLELLEPYAGQRFRVTRLLVEHAFARS